MKNEQLYNKTVDILVQAYFNDTLEHQNCAACAVGNIIAANNGIRITKTGKFYPGNNNRKMDWDFNIKFLQLPVRILSGGSIDETPECNLKTPVVKRLLSNVEYNILELALIEKSFESKYTGSRYNKDQQNNKDQQMFNGLLAVIDTLDIIHENTDTQTTTSTKQKFVKQLTQSKQTT